VTDIDQDQISALRRINDEQFRMLLRLRAYVEPDCRCPCCDTTRVCLGGCTFEQDAPDAAGRMQAARKAMRG
jgi:hypothetical protein